MKKNFVAVLVGLTFNLMPVANAADDVNNFEVTFCGYGVFSKWEQALLDKVKKNPKDAAAWHELGCFYYKLHEYAKALAAFEKAVALEPDNKQFKKDRDNAREMLKNLEKLKGVKPKFDGMG